MNGSDSNNKELTERIEGERKRRFTLLDQVKRYKRKLGYKLAEHEAIKRLAEMSKQSTKNIGYLRRKKERLEFRIATEAFTLESERELIRKKNEIDRELEEAISSYRLRRKLEYLSSDISELRKRMEETQKSLDEIELRLDIFYSNLRKQRSPARPRRKTEPVSAEVSLADIAIIKDRKDRD